MSSLNINFLSKIIPRSLIEVFLASDTAYENHIGLYLREWVTTPHFSVFSISRFLYQHFPNAANNLPLHQPCSIVSNRQRIIMNCSLLLSLYFWSIQGKTTDPNCTLVECERSTQNYMKKNFNISRTAVFQLSMVWRV